MSMLGASGGRKRASDPSPGTGITVSHQLPHGCWELNGGFSTRSARALSHWSISPPHPPFYLYWIDLCGWLSSLVVLSLQCWPGRRVFSVDMLVLDT